MKFNPMKPWQENGLFALYAAGFLFLGAMMLSACGPKDPYLKAQYVQTGPCFVWGAVEQGRMKTHKSCVISHPKIDSIYCNRQPGHTGRHHQHRHKDCLANWK